MNDGSAGSSPGVGPPNHWTYALAWLPLGAVVVALYQAQGATLAQAVRGATGAVLPVAILGIPALRLVEARAVAAGPPARRWAEHAGVALGFVVLTTLATMGAWWLENAWTSPGRPYRPSLLVAGWQALINGLVYAALAGVAQGRAHARRAERESLRAARAESLRVQADLAALRSQLNPHFVLNVLHSLVGLVRRDPGLAERALEDLGGLLGYGLRVSREERDRVPLHEEWSFVVAYLDLEKMRLGDRLDVRLDAGTGGHEALVPSFALQSLVENAIVHAIAPRAAGGILEVSARLEGDRLRLRVRDDGPGLDGRSTYGHGLGLRLLGGRLDALYAGAAELRLEAAPGGGLVATLDLPTDRAAVLDRAT